MIRGQRLGAEGEAVARTRPRDGEGGVRLPMLPPPLLLRCKSVKPSGGSRGGQAVREGAAPCRR